MESNSPVQKITFEALQNEIKPPGKRSHSKWGVLTERGLARILGISQPQIL